MVVAAAVGAVLDAHWLSQDHSRRLPAPPLDVAWRTHVELQLGVAVAMAVPDEVGVVDVLGAPVLALVDGAKLIVTVSEEAGVAETEMVAARETDISSDADTETLAEAVAVCMLVLEVDGTGVIDRVSVVEALAVPVLVLVVSPLPECVTVMDALTVVVMVDVTVNVSDSDGVVDALLVAVVDLVIVEELVSVPVAVGDGVLVAVPLRVGLGVPVPVGSVGVGVLLGVVEGVPDGVPGPVPV